MNKLFLLIEKILNLRLRGSLTIHFDGLGGSKIETKFGDESSYKILTDRK